MKSTITLGIALAVGTLGAAPQALAVPYTNNPGSICKNYYAGDANWISYTPTAIRSAQNGDTRIVCPLSRDTQNADGAYVYVDIEHKSNATTYCTAYSYSYTGTQLAAASASWTGTGFNELFIPLNGAGKSNSFSDYGVSCFIPGNRVGYVLGVDLFEF